jgi:ClpP class serine protease
MYARFDSGQFGVIAMPIESAKREWGEDWEKMAKQYMKGCIDEYNQWANGQVYAYDIIAKNGESVDFCGGYYDADEAMAEAVGIAEQYNEDDKDRIEKTLESASLKELKELFYEFTTPAPTWADELFELADESKAKEWLKTKLREIVPTDEWMEIV